MAPTNLSETLTNHVNSYSFHFQYNFFFLGKILLKSTFVLISYSIEVPYLELVSTALNQITLGWLQVYSSRLGVIVVDFLL